MFIRSQSPLVKILSTDIYQDSSTYCFDFKKRRKIFKKNINKNNTLTREEFELAILTCDDFIIKLAVETAKQSGLHITSKNIDQLLDQRKVEIEKICKCFGEYAAIFVKKLNARLAKCARELNKAVTSVTAETIEKASDDARYTFNIQQTFNIDDNEYNLIKHTLQDTFFSQRPTLFNARLPHLDEIPDLSEEKNAIKHSISLNRSQSE